MTYNYEGKMFHLMQYCAFQVSCRAIAKCHAQLFHNALIGIRNLNQRLTCTRHYPIEPLINLNCSLIHMVKMSIDKHTQHPENSKHTFLK